MLDLLYKALIGLVIGAVAKFIMPGKDPGGCVVTMIIGLVGGLLGSWLGRLLGLYGPQDAAGFIMSVIGAVVLLLIYRMIIGKRPMP